MQIFDTHAHIGLLYDDPLAQLRAIQEAKRASVVRILSICNSLHDFYSVYETLKTDQSVYHAIGVSPSLVMYSTHLASSSTVPLPTLPLM